MREALRPFQLDLKQPWQMAMLLIAIIPLFPEYISFFLAIGAAVFTWRALKSAGRRPQIGKIGKCLLGFIGYTALSLLYTENFTSSLATVSMWAVLFIVYIVCYNLLTDTAQFDTFMLWITAVAGAVGLIACFQYRVGFFTNGNPIEVWGWLDNIVYNIIPIQLSNSTYVLRACATYSNPNILSEYLTAVAPFVVYFNFHERKQDIRLFCRICLLLTFAGVLFSFSRGGYLALLLILLVLLVLNIRHHFAAVSMYAISAVLLLPDEVVERFLSIFPGLANGNKIIEGITSASGLSFTTTADIINQTPTEIAVDTRWLIWLQSLESFLEKPIFGHGAGVQTTWDIMASNNIYAAHAHNLALELLVEGGIIGLILMLLIGFMTVKNGIELIRAGYGTAFWVGIAVLGSVSSFCIQGIFDFPLMTPKLICNFMMLIAISDRATHLYTGRGIAVRQSIYRKFRRKSSGMMTHS